jgi:acetyltransferase-like isoleucine patch superfamily enzyme
MKTDIKGHLFYTIYYKWLDLKSLFCTVAIRFLWRLKGAQLSKKCKFYGYSLFVRHPDSSIIIGENCRFRSSSDSNLIGISSPCIISSHSKDAQIIIGNDCGFSGTCIMSLSSVIIGNDVLVGANTLITDCDWHNINPLKRRLPVESGKPVAIGNNVFIGYSVTVLKGVTIGDNSVIGANSVVTTDIPANCIAVGNPCKVVSEIRI